MAQDPQEFVVRVRGKEAKKQFNVMRFNAALNIDVAKLKHCKMERESLFKETKEEVEEEPPEFGAGSEYGRKEREEARRRKYEKRKHKHNNSPWILKVGGKQGKKFKGIREGGVTENTSYYVFFQAPDGAFEAFPVNEWYNFTPFQRYKALSAEEAEEKFNKRDQILNYFPLKLMKKDGEGSTDETGKKSQRSIKKDFKVSDMDDWYQSDNENASENESDEDQKPKGKIKKEKKEKRKKKGEDSDDDDEEPLEDSDEGDYDDKEVDYMSDSSSSSNESRVEEENIKGVEDESALRDLVVSEDENEEENKDENAEQTEENKQSEGEKKVKPKSEKNGNEEGISDSDFDSDNSDLDESKSALLIQSRKAQKTKGEPSEASTSEAKSAGEGGKDSNKNGSHTNGLKFKPKFDSAELGHINKKQRVEKVKNEPSDGITEDAVRRYLMRKPMTSTDLLQKFKNKVHQRDKLVSIIADILKKLSPEQQKIKGKMYFSLKPT